MAKKAARKPRPDAIEPAPKPTNGIEPKPDRFSNALLTPPEIHADLKPLCDELAQVVSWSRAMDRCYSIMLAYKESNGLPKPNEWPDSLALQRERAQYEAWADNAHAVLIQRGEDEHIPDFDEPRWTELIRDWSQYYQDWSGAIARAREAARSLAVAAIMDAGEERPTHRWTAQTIKDLTYLASTMPAITTGGPDGLGFIRDGLPPLPTDFHAHARAVSGRIVDLRSVTVCDDATLTPTRNRRPRRTELDKARDEIQIAAYLKDHPDAKRDEIAEALDIATAHVSYSKAWRAHKTQKKEASEAIRAQGAGGVGDPSLPRS